MAKIDIETIKEILETNGWKLISTDYQNLDSELEYECPEGHQVFGPWKKFRVKLECPVCASNVYKNIDSKIVAKKSGVKRVLALDQATHTSGWSIYDGKTLVKYGVFNATGVDEYARYDSIKNWLVSMIANWKPDHIALEGLQYQSESNGRPINVTVFQTLARLQGILIECCYEQKIPFTICSTNTWRHACGVKGRTRPDRKKSMQMLIKSWFDVNVTDDEADAIGIGKYMADLVNQGEMIDWE